MLIGQYFDRVYLHSVRVPASRLIVTSSNDQSKKAKNENMSATGINSAKCERQQAKNGLNDTDALARSFDRKEAKQRTRSSETAALTTASLLVAST